MEFREIHEYCRTRKESPLKKMQLVVAVVCKILRIFYTILTKGESIRSKPVRYSAKNEPVVDGNNFHRAHAWLGAKLTPRLWIDGTKEVRTLQKREVIVVDTGGRSP